ncbi:MAG: RdgB/HAM1 family non-canonical purine NTP pyrophosphatase, partial [Oscillospiraceae bacterium]|nr:RdgB/HAM1 family non-canonical purine NTP pyrophosphatase [Oscillospiraceae bacterium]
MVFAVATNNQKKLKEIQRILDSFGITAKTLKELDISIEIEENGTTFEENAVIKARTIAEIAKLPTISDDSGLEVDALNGAPGVYIARFAGEHATDDENIDKLLADMEGVEKEKRTARFVSAVCLYMPDGRNTVCRGTCEGWIGYERIGDGGFGYDPVFMVGETSYSQMSP